MLNQVNIMGRLAEDPVLQRIENGRELVYLTVACGRNYREKDGSTGVDYIDASLWGPMARNAFLHLKKGRMVVLTGHLTQRRRKDTTGVMLRELGFVADRFFFADSRPSDAPSADRPHPDKEHPQPTQRAASPEPKPAQRDTRLQPLGVSFGMYDPNDPDLPF